MADLISIVIPVYNGENSLVELYSAVKKTAELKKFAFELIFVDDSSSDQSYKKILELHQQDSRVKGIRLSKNFGQQNAIFCGFNYAVGDYIITMDDDLQHRPEDIAILYHKIKTGFDVVYAIPKDREYKFYRSLGSRLTNKLFDLITSKNKELRVSSFRILSKEILAKIIQTDKSFIYISALILQEDAKITNVYISHNKRKYGESNYNFFKLLKLFLQLYIYYGNFSLLKYFRSQKKQYSIEKSTFEL